MTMKNEINKNNPGGHSQERGKRKKTTVHRNPGAGAGCHKHQCYVCDINDESKMYKVELQNRNPIVQRSEYSANTCESSESESRKFTFASLYYARLKVEAEA